MDAAYPSPVGLSVGETARADRQRETWFNENVKPNVPGEIQQEVIELHAVEQP